jgi:putative Ca2+/H+ antiporter (TMEM165/GDT1 family)
VPVIRREEPDSLITNGEKLLVALAASFLLVVLAEMGDKTQILAMAFAAKYRPGKVLAGVFIATVLNHSLAVAAGRLLSEVVPLDIISVIAALSFILFGLWTLRGDSLDGGGKKPSRYGPILTVAVAFFLAECGDKTQLATISLAIEYKDAAPGILSAVAVLAGTTLGMLAADTIGIMLGVVLGRKLPDRAIKWFSALIFVLFGLYSVAAFLAARLALWPTVAVTGTLALATALALYRLSSR